MTSARRPHRPPHDGPDPPAGAAPREALRPEGPSDTPRARELLRRGLENALATLGQGFLAHPDNHALRAELQSRSLTARSYFDQLLCLLHRLVFLLTAEARDLLHPEGTSPLARTRYASDHGIQRLRERASQNPPRDYSSALWDSVKAAFRGLAAGAPQLGLPALQGIFAPHHGPSLDAAKLADHDLLRAIFELDARPQDQGPSPMNWRDLQPEVLGSGYAKLLELVPKITTDGSHPAFALCGETKGARRTSGSYYTPDSLVQVLLDHALDPVVADAVADDPLHPAAALLGLCIVDPACGAGHFLLAAARRLATHLARLTTGTEPTPDAYQLALRQVVTRCIHGVDLNPMAVELCRACLWLEVARPGLPLTFLDAQIQHGNALLGATPDAMAQGIPDAARVALEGTRRTVANALEKRNRDAARGQLTLATPRSTPGHAQAPALALDTATAPHPKLVADAWCAAFLWPGQPSELAGAAPTNDAWRQLRDGLGAPSALTTTTAALAAQYHFFHWHLRFPQVFARGGFDLVLGNPPWIAHAGRAAQPLPPGLKRFYEVALEGFAGYPTTHGLFVATAPRWLREGGRLGLVVPASVSDLDGYRPARTRHDRSCTFPRELVDFGEGRFPGVTQPCIALVSQRSARGRTDAAHGEPWPVERPDLTAVDRGLLARLATLPVVPPALFGERGVQSDGTLARHFVASPTPRDRFTTPIREGTDVREFELLAPRVHVDRAALAHRIRSVEDFQRVHVLVRQTARYPIAALSDGLAFRNSLLAGFARQDWTPEALLALLNSALVRWTHYMRFRDARQPVLPQVKIAHLRAIPLPRSGLEGQLPHLASLGRHMTLHAGRPAFHDLRATLDHLVADLYELTPEERSAVTRWHQHMLAATKPPDPLTPTTPPA